MRCRIWLSVDGLVPTLHRRELEFSRLLVPPHAVSHQRDFNASSTGSTRFLKLVGFVVSLLREADAPVGTGFSDGKPVT